MSIAASEAQVESTLDKLVKKGVKLTPMMQQYYEIKQKYPGILLMFRMGDFYELFFEDAIESSKILNISLTHRGKIEQTKIPMAGIPHHAASAYIDRMTSVGMKVAICEQVEDPKASKGIVKRAVTQVVSPSIPFDLDKSTQKENSYIASAYKFKDSCYLVLLDFTTGDFMGLALKNEDELLEKLALYGPKEFITFMGQWDECTKVKDFMKSGLLVTNLSEEYFQEKYTSLYIERLIPAYKRDQVIQLHPSITATIGALSYYIFSTQGAQSVVHLRPFKLISSEDDMKVTHPTLVGLEILPRSLDRYKESILGFMDATKTSMGTRHLRKIVQFPLRDLEKIKTRQAVLKSLIENDELHTHIREGLSEVRDIERIMAKATTGKINGSDLLCLAKAIETFIEITDMSNAIFNKIIGPFSSEEKLVLKDLSSKIVATINDQIGAGLEKGNLIKDGVDSKRDDLKKKTTNVTNSLLELENAYREELQITNLKIKYNNIAGYFIEVSKSHTHKVPEHFERRQTLVNSERYQTQELTNFEKDITHAKERLLKLEREIFDSLVTKVKEFSKTILKLAQSLSLIDVTQSFAYCAVQHDFICPTLHKSKKIISIKGAWHPLIKTTIKDQFVCHDIKLDHKEYFGLITGPNMAGKTTVMREVAIIQLLAQIGSFVPATECELGLRDYIFSRLGASDDISKGQSTFMVEMSETAEILRHATEDSLIVLDEIGRGTSTFDGLSIAWSLVEYFVKKTQALTLFSTHYHELIDLVQGLAGAKNFTVKTINENGKVQFLYKLIEEGAAQSFGIHVAGLAGLPAQILKRSQELLDNLEGQQINAHSMTLEKSSRSSKKEKEKREALKTDANEVATKNKNTISKKDLDQLDMFCPIPDVRYENIHSPVIEKIEKIDINNLTPLQALHQLSDIQKELLN